MNVVNNEIIPKISHSCQNQTCKINLIIPGHIKCRNKPVYETEINKIVMAVQNKCSAGYDDVPITVRKGTKQYLLKPLIHLINSSFISGIVPGQLKI